MRKVLPDVLEAGRVAGEMGSGHGAFEVLCPLLGRTLAIIAADAADWSKPCLRPPDDHVRRMPPEAAARVRVVWGDRESVTLPLPAWEHVSVSAAHGCPTWAEMCWVKDLFFEPSEWVVQLHPAADQYVNCHQYTLHLWRVVGIDFPVPPPECV